MMNRNTIIDGRFQKKVSPNAYGEPTFAFECLRETNALRTLLPSPFPKPF
jgi:hypothetical protein